MYVNQAKSLESNKSDRHRNEAVGGAYRLNKLGLREFTLMSI